MRKLAIMKNALVEQAESREIHACYGVSCCRGKKKEEGPLSRQHGPGKDYAA